MSQYHEGQNVLVGDWDTGWNEAKVVSLTNWWQKHRPGLYEVEFPNGARSVFDEKHITANTSYKSNLLDCDKEWYDD